MHVVFIANAEHRRRHEPRISRPIRVVVRSTGAIRREHDPLFDYSCFSSCPRISISSLQYTPSRWERWMNGSLEQIDLLDRLWWTHSIQHYSADCYERSTNRCPWNHHGCSVSVLRVHDRWERRALHALSQRKLRECIARQMSKENDTINASLFPSLTLGSVITPKSCSKNCSTGVIKW